jgi:hypothetical protein
MSTYPSPKTPQRFETTVRTILAGAAAAPVMRVALDCLAGGRPRPS